MARRRSRPRAATLATMLATAVAWRVAGDQLGAAGHAVVALVYGLAVTAVIIAKARRAEGPQPGPGPRATA